MSQSIDYTLAVNDLQQVLGESSPRDIEIYAILLLQRLVAEKQKGRTLALIDPDTGTPIPLNIPPFDKIPINVPS